MFFSWFDFDSDAMGLARIALRPADQTADALLYTIRGGVVEGGYAKLNTSYIAGPDRLRAGSLEFHMTEPSKWQLRLSSSRHDVDLAWTAFHPAVEFDAAALGLPPGFADNHIEQSGRVRGTVSMNGARYVIDGLGQRDKSWGARQWSAVEGWEWIPVLFSDDFTMCCIQLWHGGRPYGCGYTYHDGATHRIVGCSVDYQWASPHVPRTARITVTDSSGLHLEITGVPSSHSWLYKRGLVIQESPTRFEAVLDGARLTGMGLTEHAWHSGILGMLRILPRLVPATRMIT